MIDGQTVKAKMAAMALNLATRCLRERPARGPLRAIDAHF
jgi:hypothetical protein